MTDREFFGYDEVVEETHQGLGRNPLQIIADNPKTALATFFGILIIVMGVLYFKSRPSQIEKESFAVEAKAEDVPVKVNLSKKRNQNVAPSTVQEPIIASPTEKEEVIVEVEKEKIETPTPPIKETVKKEAKKEVTPKKEVKKPVLLAEAIPEPKEKGPSPPSEDEQLTIPVKKPAPDKENNIEAEIKNIVSNYSKVFNSGQYSKLTPELMGELMKSIQYQFEKIGKEDNTCIDFSVVKGEDEAYDYAKEIKFFLEDQGYDLSSDIKHVRTQSAIHNVWVRQRKGCVVLTVGNPSS